MSLIPRSRRVSDEERRQNDRHCHWIPPLVIAFLFLVGVLWTVDIADLPGPNVLSGHALLGEGFSKHGHLTTASWISYRDALGSHAERRLLLLLAGIGFLLAYYLPLQWKKKPLVVLTLVGVGMVFGPGSLSLMLAWHLLAYATFHLPDPRRSGTRFGIVALAFCLWFASSEDFDPTWIGMVLGTAAMAALLYPAYIFAYHPLLQTRARPWLQTSIAHSVLIYMALALAWNTYDGSNSFPRVMGWFLFFWQWERVVMYRIDLKDGRVPHDLPLSEYLATFFTPAFLSNVSWLNRIPKGYAYLANSFLARDKNRVVLSGVWLITLSVLFFYLRPVFLEAFKLAMAWLDLPTQTSYRSLVWAVNREHAPDPAWVWCVLFYRFFSFYLLWTAVAHLKVGLWRLFGYDIEPYFQNPFLSTNLVEWWRRYSFYYREFLVQAFYIPVFLRFFKRRPYLRVWVATLAAAGGGNFVYHLIERSLYRGSTIQVWVDQFQTFTYFLMLGLAISLTQIWLMARGRRRRQPWTPGWKMGLDVMAVAGTVTYFVLIRPLYHIPLRHSISDAGAVVLAAFGIR